MKYKYLPGIRPTPMLAFYNEPKKEVYLQQIQEANENFGLEIKENFYTDHEHFWNPGAYLIIKDNQIISHAISYFPHFLYLMRAINRPLVLELNENECQIFKKDFDALSEEFGVIDL